MKKQIFFIGNIGLVIIFAIYYLYSGINLLNSKNMDRYFEVDGKVVNNLSVIGKNLFEVKSNIDSSKKYFILSQSGEPRMIGKNYNLILYILKWMRKITELNYENKNVYIIELILGGF